MNHKNKISVFVITNSPNEACPIIRLISPLKYLEKEGLVKATFLFWCDCEDNLRELESKLTLADLVIIQRFNFPLEALLLFNEFIKKSKKKFILEIDDNMFEVPLTHPHFLHSFYLQDIMEKITRRVHAVTTSTKKLADYLKKYNPFVYTLPNYLDPELFSKCIPKPKNEDERIIIGYVGGPTHSKDFEIVTPAINQILKEFNGKVIFHSIGFLPEDFKKHPCAESLGYFDYKNYIKNIGGAFFDIGLGPLEDNLFNQCKSNIKFLEYGIYSIPGVWSNVLPYTEVVDDGKDGILVKHHNADSWYKTIKSLIYNPELRKRLSVNLKEKIKKYQLPQHIEKWYEVYTSLINKDRQKSEESYEVCRKFMQDFLQIKKGIYNISRVKRYDERILKFLPKTSLLLPVQELCKAYIYEMRGIRYLKHNLFKAEKYLIQAEDLLNNLQITK